MGVPSQGDPVVAITCISHPSSQATAKPQPAAPAAELQLDGVTGGDEEGMDGGLEGDSQGSPSADTAAPQHSATPGGGTSLWPLSALLRLAGCEGGSTELREVSLECLHISWLSALSEVAGAMAWLKQRIGYVARACWRLIPGR